MNNEVAIQKFTDDQKDLIKRTYCQGASDDEMSLFFHVSQRTGLDPMARQIYAVMRYSKAQKRKVMTIQTSIDGYRLIAQRSHEYQGQTEPQWCSKDGVWTNIWISKDPPFASRVGVWRKDFREPCYGIARFDAYKQTYDDGNLMGLWATMPDNMIAKCAEALALRKAFPQELSGLYTAEEMEQADNKEKPIEGEIVAPERLTDVEQMNIVDGLSNAQDMETLKALYMDAIKLAKSKKDHESELMFVATKDKRKAELEATK